LCSVAGIAFLALTSGALAGGSLKDAPEEDRKFTYSFTITGTSDYVFRGISQTDNDPTIQGSVGIGYGIFYAGAWGSGLDFAALPPPDGTGDEAQLEIDYYAGIKPTWGPATFDFGIIYYTYPGYNPGFNPEVLELKAGVSGEILPKLTAGATVYYSPDVNDLEYFVWEGTLAYALPKVWIFDPVVSGTVGHYDWEHGGTDYTYWNAGLALVVDKLTFDFRYWDTDASSTLCTYTCDERFVFSATVALP